MNPIAKESLLFDCYGSLLTEKKRRVMELYHEEDLSLGEIAEEFGISRAAVHDSLKSAERQLEDYEAKLGMVQRLSEVDRLVNQMCEILTDVERTYGQDERALSFVQELRGLAQEMNKK